ncbi:archaellin/type IV pilin N-terminal domain-containing protein [Halobium palmae]|uniref:Flagellin n=1 Tax=Halobium palmae TaxID=1776492 RepID=A0ABD5RWT2_9EURY
MFEFITDEEDRGQVGIGTLIVFIAMVLVAAIAAGVLINTAGFLQSSAEQTGQQSSAQVTDRLEPVAKTGSVASDGSVDTIEMVIQKSPGASDIDLKATTLEFVGPQGVDRIALSDLADGSISTLKDDDSSISDSSVLNSREDRVVLTLDLTSEFDSDLSLLEGQSATMRINTESGATSIIRVKVPESTSGESAVEL